MAGLWLSICYATTYSLRSVRAGRRPRVPHGFAGPRFEVAPVAEWVHISETLEFIEAEVEPVIGDVQPVSGFRNAELNQCAGGAKASAHRHFYALDLVPVDDEVSRAALIRDVCRIHQAS